MTISSTATVTVERRIIPTYPSPTPEELPMFAENRVHQRSSGDPYPNKVVLRVDRTQTVDKEYEVVILENRYVRVEILPSIGGRIYSALDKTTGYDFFYKQHVIKPALIGVFGSWVSGGVEFNWPFHHRASGFMACDYALETLSDGSVVCHLSEHEPTDRMKGMVSVILPPDGKWFETRMRLYNRTNRAHSFLWWENAAVPVNEDYQIFFPPDVTYVNFHYLKSRTTYPLAGNGIYNGIPMVEERDISWHKNTRPATSYFASASSYDFFGGYDHGKRCGVVHIGDHHVTPGKKMFTWGYNQLSRSWENALTDTDGQYAELMAGSYSDNQPDFAWLEPYETKEFSQFWYPISEIGTPTFANLCCALKIERGAQNLLKVQSTQPYSTAEIALYDGDKCLFTTTCTLAPERCVSLDVREIPDYVTVVLTADGGEIARYAEEKPDTYNMPEPITDMPAATSLATVEELYLAGVHVDQYRDPAVKPDAYWLEGLKRDNRHIDTLIAMAKYEYDRYDNTAAEDYITRAITETERYNKHPRSGEVYYTYGLILEACGNRRKAYDMYAKAAWAADCTGRAMTRLAVQDMYFGDKANAIKHACCGLDYGRNNCLAAAVLALCGDQSEAARLLARDPLDHLLRFVLGAEDLYAPMDSDPAQTCLDMAYDLADMGQWHLVEKLLCDLVEARPDCGRIMVHATIGYARFQQGLDGTAAYKLLDTVDLGPAYPVRREEMEILADVIEKTDSARAKMLLGCLLYHKRHYAKAASLWEQCTDVIAKRNLAVAYFSHLHREGDALPLLQEALAMATDPAMAEQLVYETAVLMDKSAVPAGEKIAFLTAHTLTRDDCVTELAKAYNQALEPEKSLETLLSHRFVPCEGGEHAIADQYLFAHLLLGSRRLADGDLSGALSFFRDGQVLPQSLGAGIWNHCKLVPLRYMEALCLEKQGETEEAQEIFRYIAHIGIEYFSNMHLKELPYYQVMAWRHLGEEGKARLLVTKYAREWEQIAGGFDNGFFGTTPFFISFTDDPKKLRMAQYHWLTGLMDALKGQTDLATDKMKKAYAGNTELLYALAFGTMGFIH